MGETPNTKEPFVPFPVVVPGRGERVGAKPGAAEGAGEYEQVDILED